MGKSGVITEEIKKRISLVRESTECEDLKKNLCPFFEKGGCTDCIICDKSEAALQECKSIYLERIVSAPMLVWSEEFDNPVAYSRDTVSPHEITGIGVNCNRCYMSDKCPLYKKDYVCGIDWGSDKPNNSGEFFDFLIGLQYERVKRQSVFEKIDGGVPDAGLSSEMDRLSSLIYSKANLNRERLSINVEATGSASSSGGGILSKIFGGSSTESLPEKSSVGEYIEAVEIKEPEKVRRTRKNAKENLQGTS